MMLAASHNYAITICDLPCHLPTRKFNGETDREGHKLLGLIFLTHAPFPSPSWLVLCITSHLYTFPEHCCTHTTPPQPFLHFLPPNSTCYPCASPVLSRKYSLPCGSSCAGIIHPLLLPLLFPPSNSHIIHLPAYL